mmetsp:Transcript_54114/g.139784  ORF Transcript_54114/g.139784 Transcript_54114/m.139784 type:complete len:226 (-) Transcript_54114:237-914(-)
MSDIRTRSHTGFESSFLAAERRALRRTSAVSGESRKADADSAAEAVYSPRKPDMLSPRMASSCERAALSTCMRIAPMIGSWLKIFPSRSARCTNSKMPSYRIFPRSFSTTSDRSTALITAGSSSISSTASSNRLLVVLPSSEESGRSSVCIADSKDIHTTLNCRRCCAQNRRSSRRSRTSSWACARGSMLSMVWPRIQFSSASSRASARSDDSAGTQPPFCTGGT